MCLNSISGYQITSQYHSADGSRAPGPKIPTAHKHKRASAHRTTLLLRSTAYCTKPPAHSHPPPTAPVEPWPPAHGSRTRALQENNGIGADGPACERGGEQCNASITCNRWAEQYQRRQVRSNWAHVQRWHTHASERAPRSPAFSSAVWDGVH